MRIVVMRIQTKSLKSSPIHLPETSQLAPLLWLLDPDRATGAFCWAAPDERTYDTGIGQISVRVDTLITNMNMNLRISINTTASINTHTYEYRLEYTHVFKMVFACKNMCVHM